MSQHTPAHPSGTMSEAQRQWYLKAMGLTPWVARQPLPGAAPSPVLDWDEEIESDPTAAAPEAVVAQATPIASPQRPAPPPERPVSRTAEPAEQPPRPAPGGTERLTFTLEAHLAGETWVMFEQEQAQAPGLGRFGAPLAASLLALFGAAPPRPRRFYCPLTDDQPMGREEAGQALRAFLDGLTRQGGGERVLLCIGEAHARALFGCERYRGFALGQRPALAISTLAEMLAEPVAHKSRSWRAMVAEGFTGAAV
jgi:hypothetical protein